MNIIAYGNSSGSKYWRLEHPFKYLRKIGHEAWVSDEGITEKALDWADVIVFNSVVYKEGIALARQYQVEKGKKLVVDVDDWFDLNEDSPFKIEHKISEAPFVIKKTIEIADLVTCTNKVLSERIAKINPNVKVLPNYMDMEFWDREKQFNTSDKIRIGWAGSMTHLHDLQMVVKPLKRIMEDYNAELIIIGEQRMADEFKGYPVECMVGVPFDAWPERLHGLRLDIGIAPLVDTPFNQAKSNIKWQEYSIAKVPGVYSPTVYQHPDFEPKFGIVALDEDHWYRAIKHLIDYPQRREEIREASYTYVKGYYDLGRHIKEWERAYQLT